jgi:NAD(P)-dependent dehydrogenase (short-subunit alcohol dehydrogenase family)
LSVVRSNHAFLPLLIEQREGHIVNTASFAGLYTYAFDRLPYAATKAAVVQISEGLSLYLRPYGVGVTCLCPGPVATGIIRSLKSFGPDTDTQGPGPQFRLLDPAEVGRIVVDAVLDNRFMVPTDPLVNELLVNRASDWDAFLDEMSVHPHVVARARR